MKVILLFTLLSLSLISCHHEQEYQKKTALCLARTEFTKAIQSIRSMGFDNFIKIKLTFQGLSESLKNVAVCLSQNMVVENFHGGNQDILEDIGISSLLLSNCGKDVGGAFLLLDNIIKEIKSDKPDWVGVVVQAVMDVIFTKQGYGDCKDAINYIIGLFQKKLK